MYATAVPAHDGGIESLRQTGKAFASVARKVSPSVVFIQTESIEETRGNEGFHSPFSDELFRHFFGDSFPGFPERKPRERRQRKVGQGSGFVFSLDNGIFRDRAYILTNNHVIDDADRITVTFEDGRELAATVKGTDPQSDIAVLEVGVSDVPALSLGDSGSLEVGEWVVAIGNPFGLSHTLTAGVVSAKGRSSLGINDYEDFIQTDAVINPGNSGGPLVNLDGEVVGINTAIFSRSGGYMGVGFAIPINMARGVATQLLQGGEVSRGYLGISIQQLTRELAESFGLGGRKGVLVSQITRGSPAEEAGLREGDLIVRYQGEPVVDSGNLRNRISLTPPGTEAEMRVVRGGREKALRVRIASLEDAAAAIPASSAAAEELGITVQDVTPELASKLGIRPGEGVVVTGVRRGSVAGMAGIEPGSVILQVNRQPVRSATEFAEHVSASGEARRVLLQLSRRGTTYYVVLHW
jgi:serine protease Do